MRRIGVQFTRTGPLAPLELDQSPGLAACRSVEPRHGRLTNSADTIRRPVSLAAEGMDINAPLTEHRGTVLLADRVVDAVGNDAVSGAQMARGHRRGAGA
ncbi:MAG: hypothetical protein CTY20_12270 [Hyphomicrobium sp.]|nr:MAG: hypothetical protein CTY20_12270 [Hyphomicrobium sp.]